MVTKIFIPNIVTLSNLLLGLISLLYTMNEQYAVAAVAILLAMLMDGMDGKIARKLDAASDFGKQLDSLCDLVSFGVAPSLLIYNSSLRESGLIALIVVLLFPLCGAVRLAKFNVSEAKDYFIGIPITLAGALLAFIVLISLKLSLPIMFLSLLIFLLSYLMVSNLKIPKY